MTRDDLRPGLKLRYQGKGNFAVVLLGKDKSVDDMWHTKEYHPEPGPGGNTWPLPEHWLLGTMSNGKERFVVIPQENDV